MNVRDIAQLCHEVNRAYCEALGDTSQPAWDAAPDWQRNSAVKGVEFHMMNDASPRAGHDNWFAQKEREGWRYGDVKDPVNKEHPCMLPYDELPAEQRAKDYIFSAIVRTVRSIDGEKMGDGVAGDRVAA